MFAKIELLIEKSYVYPLIFFKYALGALKVNILLHSELIGTITYYYITVNYNDNEIEMLLFVSL